MLQDTVKGLYKQNTPDIYEFILGSYLWEKQMFVYYGKHANNLSKVTFIKEFGQTLLREKGLS